MAATVLYMSVSLDGFVAGLDQTIDARWTAALLRPCGAYVMVRNMFGPVRGRWSSYEAEHSPWATHVRYRVRPSSASRRPGRR